MRLISFALTEPQFLDGTKDVTRRLGWKKLKAGDSLMAVNKAMGLRPGERQRRLGVIVVVSVRRESLWSIDEADCRREGFPEKTPMQFVEMFCHHMGCEPETEVTRIEFRRV